MSNVRGRRSKSRPRVTEKHARESWSKDLERAEPGSDLEAGLVRVGQANGWVGGDGKLVKPPASPGTVTRLNDDLRAALRPGRVIGPFGGEAS
jgi:hypothetical protein